MDVIFPLLNIVIILVGLLGLLDEKFVITLIKFKNQLKGVKSEITPLTIKAAKIQCLAAVVVGGLMFYYFYNSFA